MAGKALGALIFSASTLAHVDPISAQTGSPYFPPEFHKRDFECTEGFLAPRKTALMSESEAEWYQRHLRAAREPSLYATTREAGASGRILRFTWLRSFHPPVIVRVDESADGKARMVAKELSGYGGYEPGHVAKTVERLLSAAEWLALKNQVDRSRLMETRQPECILGADGAQWILEQAVGSSYGYAVRWSPANGAVRELGLAMMALTGWTFNPTY